MQETSSNSSTSTNKKTPPLFDAASLDLLREGGGPPPRKPWWRRGSMLALISLLLVIALLVGGYFSLRLLRGGRVTYATRTVGQGNLAVTVSATGPVLGRSYGANFLVTGRVSEIDVAVGQRVKAGQVLAKVDATALQDAVNQAQDSLTQAQDNGNQDAINIAQDQLNAAKHNLNNATLKAPHAGVVTAINGTVGGLASATGAGNAFIALVDASALQVQANVNESDIGGVKVGQSAQFTVNAYGTRAFSGKVAAIAPQGVTSSTSASVVTYPVMINVDTRALQNVNLLPGMTANVTIAVAQRSNALLIPVDAVNYAQSQASAANGVIGSDVASAALTQANQMLATLTRAGADLAKDNPTPAYVLEQRNGQWSAKAIVLGLSDGASYEVLTGLNVGEEIVVGQQTRGGSGGSNGG